MAQDQARFLSGDVSGGEKKPVISPEEEIRELEEKLAEKKREIAARGAVFSGAPEGAPRQERGEKDLFREVVREHIGEMEPLPAPAASAGEPLISALRSAPAPSSAPSAPQNPQNDQTREEQLKALVEFAMARGISAAVEKAEAQSPYLLDALHDRLADEYYEKMVVLRKLKSL